MPAKEQPSPLKIEENPASLLEENPEEEVKENKGNMSSVVEDFFAQLVVSPAKENSENEEAQQHLSQLAELSGEKPS